MTRLELFAQAYPERGDTSSMFASDYQILKTLWDIIPEEERDHILELPEALHVFDEPIPESLLSTDEEEDSIANEKKKALLQQIKETARIRAEHVRMVDLRFRHRMSSVFANDLPDIFRRVMMRADDPYTFDLLFFGTMTALSCCLPGVKGSYDLEEIQPNLFLFVTGNAAAGKGRIGLCRKLLEPLHHKYHDFWNFIIPANSSDTAIYTQLAINEGYGIIFETEADTLSNALGKASGKFSEGLRKAFHNEAITYQRRTRNERVEIPHPYLSVLLTGTPRQLQRLIKDPEDGLFSRFLFYRLGSNQESYPAKNPLHQGITGEMMNDYMHYLGRMVLDFFERLERKAQSSPNGIALHFRLSEEQEEQFQQHFNKATREYVQLFYQMYRSEERSAEAETIMRRMGNICFRMMMILSVSRLIDEKKPEIPDELTCDPRDFARVMELEPQLRYHNNIHYDDMLVANKTVAPLEEENSDSGDMLTPLQRQYFEALPNSFTRKMALQVAEQMGEEEKVLTKDENGVAKVAKVAKTAFPERTIDRYLSRYCDLGILTHVKQGRYEKFTTTNCIPTASEESLV